ncbi:MAG: hypothetical protein K6D02_08490 [Lachnospiraceae bacterium]|nr:hypothetical protein [Lachnospiraceae bacterium]
MNHRNICVGVDLSDSITQISCYDDSKKEPISIGVSYNGNMVYEIPTVLGYNIVNGMWYYGQEASEKGEAGKCISFRNILKLAAERDIYRAGTYKFNTYELLKRFVGRVLTIIKAKYPYDKISMLTLTVDELTGPIKMKLVRILEENNIPQNRYKIVDYKMSYMNYAVSQNSDLWQNNIGLFMFYRKFDKENKTRLMTGLKYIQINVDRSSTPFLITSTVRDLRDIFLNDIEALKTDEEKIKAFADMASAIFYKNVITTVYITGSMYVGDWLNKSLKKLCGGRRIFKGENLYSRGACYTSMNAISRDEKNYVIVDESGVSSNIYFKLYNDARMENRLVVRAGSKWEQVDENFDIIPDDEEELVITIENIVTKQKRVHILSLNDFFGRENKMSRFSIRVRFASIKEVVITVKDCGFGEFYESSNRIWELVIET